MAETVFMCPMCGHCFDPAAHGACRACPLRQGCQVLCCPDCGYQTLDPARSRLARWWDSLHTMIVRKGGRIDAS